MSFKSQESPEEMFHTDIKKKNYAHNILKIVPRWTIHIVQRNDLEICE